MRLWATTLTWAPAKHEQLMRLHWFQKKRMLKVSTKNFMIQFSVPLGYSPSLKQTSLILIKLWMYFPYFTVHLNKLGCRKNCFVSSLVEIGPHSGTVARLYSYLILTNTWRTKEYNKTLCKTLTSKANQKCPNFLCFICQKVKGANPTPTPLHRLHRTCDLSM